MPFSREQQRAIDLFKQGKNIFITGPGGTGKTHVIQHMVQHMNALNMSYQVCAMTGCAAVLLNTGNSTPSTIYPQTVRTLHSWSGIGLGNGPFSKIQQKVLYNKRAAARWRTTKILIVDEVSMMSKKIFETIEKIACAIRKEKTQPFGGMQIVFCGDFFQLPPVGNVNEEDSELFCFESDKWLQVFPQEAHVQLTHIFRQDDDVYKRILHQIRWGELDEECAEILQKQMGKEIDPENVPTKLYAVRAKTDFVNMNMYAKLQTEEYVYEMMTKTDIDTYTDCGKLIPSSLIEQRRQMTLPELTAEIDALMNMTNRPKLLRLKKGARVMCLHNYDLDRGICNGAQGTVVDFAETTEMQVPVPIVHFTNGVRMKMNLVWQQSDEMPCIGIGQLPLCLAWALTIHKIQGATLSMAEMDLGNSVFEYGQTYVALSRVKNLQGLYISALNPAKIKANPVVKEFYRNLPIESESTSPVGYEEKEKEKEEKEENPTVKSGVQIRFVKKIIVKKNRKTELEPEITTKNVFANFAATSEIKVSKV